MRTCRRVACKRDNSHFLCYVLRTLKEKSCAGHYSYTVWDNLNILGRDIHQVLKMCHIKKDNSCFVLFLVISPERISKPNSCALRKFLMV